MRKTILAIVILLTTGVVNAQLVIQGSIQRGSDLNKVDVLLKSAYTSAPGEFVNFLQFALAVPATGNTNLSASFVATGNFAGLTFTPAPAYVQGGEKVFNWVCLNPNVVTTMSWTAGTPFAVGTVTFSNGDVSVPTTVKMVDYTNAGGGANAITFFAIGTTNAGNDPTDYGTLFFELTDPGNESTLKTDGNGDRYVETEALVTLPVSILNFSGFKSGAKNVLKWNTASELNNLGFEVLRSADGVNYTSIGFVNSKAIGGNSSAELSYSFDDNSPVTSKRSFYQLKQKDIDGRAKLSNIVVINGEKPTTIAIGGLFPNPATTTVNVIIDAPKREDVTIQVMDLFGKTIRQRNANVETGSNSVPVDVAGLSKGSYFIKVIGKTSETESAVSKLVVQ